MSLVLDSSVTLAWLYGDETSEAVRAVLVRVQDTGAWVPAIWRLEVANGLQQGIRRARIDASFRDASLDDLSDLSIEIDMHTNAYAWTATLALADRFGLTLYDASYLELALRRALPLATLDRELDRAADALGVERLGS